MKEPTTVVLKALDLIRVGTTATLFNKREAGHLSTLAAPFKSSPDTPVKRHGLPSGPHHSCLVPTVLDLSIPMAPLPLRNFSRNVAAELGDSAMQWLKVAAGALDVLSKYQVSCAKYWNF